MGHFFQAAMLCNSSVGSIIQFFFSFMYVICWWSTFLKPQRTPWTIRTLRKCTASTVLAKFKHYCILKNNFQSSMKQINDWALGYMEMFFFFRHHITVVGIRRSPCKNEIFEHISCDPMTQVICLHKKLWMSPSSSSSSPLLTEVGTWHNVLASLPGPFIIMGNGKWSLLCWFHSVWFHTFPPHK